MPRIDPAQAPRVEGSRYPAPHDAPCRGRSRLRLGKAAGLTQFGVNLLRLDPGAWSSQRHWHHAEDEFVFVVEGEVVLVTGAGDTVLLPGDSAGFRAGEPDGHHLQNRTDRPALVLEVGSSRPAEDVAEYADIDMRHSQATGYTRRDGSRLG